MPGIITENTMKETEIALQSKLCDPASECSAEVSPTPHQRLTSVLTTPPLSHHPANPPGGPDAALNTAGASSHTELWVLSDGFILCLSPLFKQRQTF